MTILMSDPLNGTPGASLSGTTAPVGGAGATWTHYAASLTFSGTAADVYTGSGGINLNNVSMPSADYYVKCNVQRVAEESAAAGVILRYVGGTGGNERYQFVLRDGSINAFRLEYIADDGTITVIDEDPETLAAATYTLRAEVVGSNFQCYVNDILRCSGTNSTISSTGKPGLYMAGDGSANHRILDVEVGDFSTPSGGDEIIINVMD